LLLYLNCLYANLAYGLPELNKLTYLLTYLLELKCCGVDEEISWKNWLQGSFVVHCSICYLRQSCQWLWSFCLSLC